jgi:Flp pilus assembly pilin Flp
MIGVKPVRHRPPSLLRDRRGVGVAEYALMLFIVIAVVAIAYRFIGKSVKHAGNQTEEQFQGGGSGGAGGAGNAAGNKTAANANSAGGGAQAGGTAGTAGGGTTTAGGSGGGSGGANAGGGVGGGKAATADRPGNASGDDEEEERSTPLWKIIGGVFVVLFAIGGYFAFRKQSKGG